MRFDRALMKRAAPRSMRMNFDPAIQQARA